jgi:dolichol-phosphate mannosyltransferase
VLVDHFKKLPERNRFIPGLRTWLGFESTTVIYDRKDRAAGKPKQTLRRLIRYAMDGMISFSYKPLRWVTYFGFVVSCIAFLLIPTYITLAIVYPNQVGRGFFTILLCVLFLGGVQLISIGILGEYIGRIYEESKQRPLYVVGETVGI